MPNRGQQLGQRTILLSPTTAPAAEAAIVNELVRVGGPEAEQTLANLADDRIIVEYTDGPIDLDRDNGEAAVWFDIETKELTRAEVKINAHRPLPEVVATVVHEVGAHASTENIRQGDRSDREAHAHIIEEYFRSRAGYPPYRPEYRRRDGSINERRIRQDMNAIYRGIP